MTKYIRDGHTEISVQKLEKTVVININGNEIALSTDSANELAEALHIGDFVPVVDGEFFYHTEV